MNINQYIKVKGLYKQAEPYDVVKEYEKYLPTVTENKFSTDRIPILDLPPYNVPYGSFFGLKRAPDMPILKRTMKINNGNGEYFNDNSFVFPFEYSGYGRMDQNEDGTPKLSKRISTPETVEKDTRDILLDNIDRECRHRKWRFYEGEPKKFTWGYRPIEFGALDFTKDPKGWKQLAEMVGKPEYFVDRNKYHKGRNYGILIGGGVGGLGGYGLGSGIARLLGWNKFNANYKNKRKWLKALSTLGGAGLGAYTGYRIGNSMDEDSFRQDSFYPRSDLRDALNNRLNQTLEDQLENGKGAVIESYKNSLPELVEAVNNYPAEAKGTVGDSPEFLRRWFNSEKSDERAKYKERLNQLHKEIYGE